MSAPTPEQIVEALVYAIANDLERSIAALGYPVGCGMAPHPDTCAAAARAIVGKISDNALSILQARASTGGDGR